MASNRNSAIFQRLWTLYGRSHIFSDRYRSITPLLLQGRFHPGLLLNHCFYKEISDIKFKTTRETSAIRYDYWLGVIDSLAKGKIENSDPWASLLIESRGGRPISQTERSWYKSIISGFSNYQDIGSKTNDFFTIDDFESFAEKTDSSLLYLNLETVGVMDPQVDAVVSHLGKFMGLTRFLSTSLFLFNSQMLHIPLDILTKNGIQPHSLYKPGVIIPETDSNDNKMASTDYNSKFLDVMFELATRANDRIISAKTYSKTPSTNSVDNFSLTSNQDNMFDSSNSIRLACLNTIPYQLYLKDLESFNFDTLDKTLLSKDYITKDTPKLKALSNFISSSKLSYNVLKGKTSFFI